MVYNLSDASLPIEQRRVNYERDFALLQSKGVNTILGYGRTAMGELFDGLTLDVAQQQGLGVVMPFDLRPDDDYADPAVQHRYTDGALALVEAYKDHPALRMWRIGNEVFHDIDKEE